MDLVNRERLEAVFEPSSREEFDGAVIESRRRLTGTRSCKHTTVILADGSVQTFEESVRLYRPGEIKVLFRDAGLRDLRFYGHFDGRTFDAESPRMIVIGTRA